MNSKLKYLFILLNLLLVVSIGINIYQYKKIIPSENDISACNEIINKNLKKTQPVYNGGSYSSDDYQSTDKESAERYNSVIKANSEIEAETDPGKREEMINNLVQSFNK